MRSFTKLVMASALLATQATPLDSSTVAAAVTTSVPTVVSAQSQITFATTSPSPVGLKLPAKPDYDAEVLAPLRAKQAADAAAAAAKANAARLARARAAIALYVPVGSPVDWMTAAGIDPANFGYVDYIVNHEASWSGVTRYNYGGSGAYGLFQALPGSKMAPYGADWQTNPVTQIRWANAYAVARYGSWAGAYNHWLGYHSW